MLPYNIIIKEDPGERDPHMLHETARCHGNLRTPLLYVALVQAATVASAKAPGRLLF